MEKGLTNSKDHVIIKLRGDDYEKESLYNNFNYINKNYLSYEV